MKNINLMHALQTVSNKSSCKPNIGVSFSSGPVSNTRVEFKQVTWSDLCDYLKSPDMGEKQGSYICVGEIKYNYRKAENVQYPHDFFVIDGDSRITEDGSSKKGAPDPTLIHSLLTGLNIQHLIYSTHSNKEQGDDYHRYRLIIPALISSHKELKACVNWAISELQKNGIMLANASENTTRSNPWLLPRVTKDNQNDYYFVEHSKNCTEFPVQEAVRQFKSLVKNPNANTRISVTGCNIPVKDVINGVPEGCRDIMIFRYAHYLRIMDINYQKKRDMILEASSNCKPSFEQDKALEKLDRIHKQSNSESNIADQYESLSLSESGNISRFIAQYGHVIRYPDSSDKYSVKNWLYYNGSSWVYNTDSTIERYAKEAIESILAEDFDARSSENVNKFYNRSNTVKHIQLVLEGASWEKEVRVNLSDVDLNPMLIGTPTGIVDLETGEILQDNRSQIVTKKTKAVLEEDVGCPIWDDHLERVSGGDEDMISFLNMLVAYCLTGKTNEQKLCILHGPGGSGKSTYINTVKRILGNYSSQLPVKTLSINNSNAIDDNLSRIKGARIAVTSEISKTAKLKESLVKQLTGGDDIVGRKMHKGSEEYTPTYKIIMVVNDLPEITGGDDAMDRRVLVIPFDQKLKNDKMDKDLMDKLKDEYNAIFTRAVKLCSKWPKGGITYPDKVIKASDAYVESQDVFKLWYNACCSTDANNEDFASSEELLESHTTWCSDSGERNLNNTEFHNRLSSLDRARKGKKRINGEQPRGYFGIRLK